MTTALVPVDQVERMALAVAKSGLFGVKTPDQAMALMLIAQAEGLHPAIAARDYHVINGRPTLKADAMLARFHSAGGSVRWGEYTDRRVVGTFSHPQGGSVEVEWTLDMATAAGLTKNPTWKSYPRQMLRARPCAGTRPARHGAGGRSRRLPPDHAPDRRRADHRRSERSAARNSHAGP
jgi:hypothetical protein